MKIVELSPITKLLKGVDIVADAVGGTLGPKGRNGFIDDAMVPRITNDGKSIADSITLPDKLENLGAWLVKNAADQTNDDAGDGTTTTTVLLQAIVHEALKRPENPMEIARSLKEALPGIVKAIKASSHKVEDLKQVALISAEDEELASMIADLVEKVGEKGTVMLEESNDGKNSYEFVNGYEAHVGYYSPHFVTNTQKMIAEYSKIGIFVTEKKISNVGDINHLFTELQKEKVRQLVIVCEDIDQQMLGVFVQNHLMKLFNLLVIKATGPLLEDIAYATGATPVSDTTGVNFDNFDVKQHLGHALKVKSEEKRTVFVSDAKSAKEQATRLENFAENNPDKFQAKKARERAAKLRGGVAVMRVGSASTVDMGYLKDKAEDAIHATQAALEEGVVEGGGMCLWHIAQTLKGKTVGEQILKKALTAPLRKICENAGKEYTDVAGNLTVLSKMGYDAQYDEYPDMIAKGIIDPAKVERCAITNALLNAAQFITTHVAITDKPEEKK